MQNIPRPHKHPTQLVFDIETSADVQVNQIFGALYNETEVIEPFSLSTLQKSGQAGKCIIDQANGGFKLRIPLTAPPSVAALLAAAVEEINNVAGRPARFKLSAIVDQRARMVEVAKRAQSIMGRAFQDLGESV